MEQTVGIPGYKLLTENQFFKLQIEKAFYEMAINNLVSPRLGPEFFLLHFLGEYATMG
jgi:hypothetical protein